MLRFVVGPLFTPVRYTPSTLDSTTADSLHPCSQSGLARIKRPFVEARESLNYPLSRTISIVYSAPKVRTLQTRVPRVALTKLRLETSCRNGVPAFCPVFSGLQTGSCFLSPACQISLGILGEMPVRRLDCSFHEHYHYALRSAPMPPCGVPSSVG